MATIDNQRIAAARITRDTPTSIYFFNQRTELRIDLLLDYPIEAAELLKNAKPTKVQSQTFRVAARKDLLRLKELAYKDRAAATDLQGIEFLKKSTRK